MLGAILYIIVFEELHHIVMDKKKRCQLRACNSCKYVIMATVKGMVDKGMWQYDSIISQAWVRERSYGWWGSLINIQVSGATWTGGPPQAGGELWLSREWGGRWECGVEGGRRRCSLLVCVSFPLSERTLSFSRYTLYKVSFYHSYARATVKDLIRNHYGGSLLRLIKQLHLLDQEISCVAGRTFRGKFPISTALPSFLYTYIHIAILFPILQLPFILP